ncbi:MULTISPECIES: ABC transporter ATP-binding protein [Rhodococcus]|jgi:peptide/nickel transport system ATP-binding protein|uniref:dipeptide ABC transporter ATP-binding protein n=1 Tax=Rhodococcus TaxID=1827 RepID=UPI0004929C02|nr:MULTISPECIES: ABC transporter ATP-binding protein [Rhodococcus]MCW0190995.1 ABC transporter ATP-binding protein [Rhodococcus sp. (in: high G+C Gram-positive bacteria)]ALU72411.1 ABC transporter ATP-binding protein [Rhodococcus erythropolis R138]MBO8150552.1 ABC transporter ATP-binding protein [Rhodococcus erythropolis]MBS2990523.1 ABC transporter ATP-binding protein [Rhodococcus erythropolis]MCW2299815.1 peptide/nickel transport system ATP-binding protein [Rhodococcus erythropolis]
MSTTEEQLLSVTDLQIAYGAEPAVSGVSFTVGRGEVVAVVGESGSGKSTTAHAILGLLAGSGHVTGGTVEFEGEQIDSYSDRAWQRIRGARIGLVPQDPTTSLNPVTRIGDQVAEVLRIHGLADRRKARLDAVEVLERAGIDRPEIRARQYPHELSGGMRQRVLIGIALVANPALIIADEPTSALDVTVQRRILDHLDERIAESGAAVLLITHDLGVAADRADRILVMQGGRIVESGRTADILDNPRHEYTKKLLDSAPSLSSGPVDRPVRQDTSPLLTLTGITKRFNVGRGSSITAVNEVSLTVPRGQTVSLVGESGSGKSTTARIAVRLEQADAGTISFDGHDITKVKGSDLRELRRKIQLVYQNPYASLDPKLSVQDIVAEPLRAFKVGGRSQQQSRAAELLDQVALPEQFLSRKPAELSGGQRQRVAIARALALKPDLLVLDEPVSALDVSVQAQILALLDELQRELGLTYLFISHDLAVVRQISDVVGVMQAGRLLEIGTTTEIFDNPRNEYTRTLLDAIPGRDHSTRKAEHVRA